MTALGQFAVVAGLAALFAQHQPAGGPQKHLLWRLLAGSSGGTSCADQTLSHGQPPAQCRDLHLRGTQNHSTLFLARKRAMGLHSDRQNHESVRNVLIPLSDFVGGHLFVESEEGDVSLDVH